MTGGRHSKIGSHSAGVQLAGVRHVAVMDATALAVCTCSMAEQHVVDSGRQAQSKDSANFCDE